MLRNRFYTSGIHVLLPSHPWPSLFFTLAFCILSGQVPRMLVGKKNKCRIVGLYLSPINIKRPKKKTGRSGYDRSNRFLMLDPTSEVGTPWNNTSLLYAMQLLAFSGFSANLKSCSHPFQSRKNGHQGNQTQNHKTEKRE